MIESFPTTQIAFLIRNAFWVSGGGAKARYNKYACKGTWKGKSYKATWENIVSRYQTLVSSLSRETVFPHRWPKTEFITRRPWKGQPSDHWWKFCSYRTRIKSLLRRLKNIGMVSEKLYRKGEDETWTRGPWIPLWTGSVDHFHGPGPSDTFLFLWKVLDRVHGHFFLNNEKWTKIEIFEK